MMKYSNQRPTRHRQTMPPTVRDRTREFFATVDSFQQHGHPTSKQSTSPSSITKLPKTSIEQSSRIRNLATQIAENIEEVEQKIIELEQLAKLTSNFRDERPKIQSLMLTIKKDIERITMDLNALKTYLSQSFSTLHNTHHCIGHHKSLHDVLNARYFNLAKAFASACQFSMNHLQRQKQEREKFGFGGSKKTSFRKVPLNRLQRRRQTQNTGSNSENEALLSGDSSQGHQLKGASQSQSQMMMYKDNEYAEQKVKEAEQIETQLTEISQMMSKLASIVDEQRQTIITIGDNVEESIENMDGAIQQLQKYLSSLSGNRWLMIKVFALLIFLALIFTVFIA
eukprot:326643_1